MEAWARDNRDEMAWGSGGGGVVGTTQHHQHRYSVRILACGRVAPGDCAV
jgi:hypothetical protein